MFQLTAATYFDRPCDLFTGLSTYFTTTTVLYKLLLCNSLVTLILCGSALSEFINDSESNPSGVKS